MLVVLTESKIEVARRLGGPQSHGVDDVVAVARDGRIVGHGENGLVVDPVLPALVVLRDAPEELDWEHVFGASLLPRVAIAEPVVRLFNLTSVEKKTIREY